MARFGGSAAESFRRYFRMSQVSRTSSLENLAYVSELQYLHYGTAKEWILCGVSRTHLVTTTLRRACGEAQRAGQRAVLWRGACGRGGPWGTLPLPLLTGGPDGAGGPGMIAAAPRLRGVAECVLKRALEV